MNGYFQELVKTLALPKEVEKRYIDATQKRIDEVEKANAGTILASQCMEEMTTAIRECDKDKFTKAFLVLLEQPLQLRGELIHTLNEMVKIVSREKEQVLQKIKETKKELELEIFDLQVKIGELEKGGKKQEHAVALQKFKELKIELAQTPSLESTINAQLHILDVFNVHLNAPRAREHAIGDPTSQYRNE